MSPRLVTPTRLPTKSFNCLISPFRRPQLIAGTVDVGIDDFDLRAAQHGAQRGTGRRAEVKIAGHQRLSRDAAAGADHFHGKAFVAVVTFFDGDELVHVASGDGSDGKTDFFFRRAQDLRRGQRVDQCCAKHDWNLH